MFDIENINQSIVSSVRTLSSTYVYNITAHDSISEGPKSLLIKGKESGKRKRISGRQYISTII